MTNSHIKTYTMFKRISHTCDQTISTCLTNKYPEFWPNNIHSCDQQTSTSLINNLQFWPTHIHTIDQTISTMLTNKYPQCWPTHIHSLTKLRHWGCRSLVSKFGRHLIEHLDFTMCFIYRANFDQTSTLGVSKFGRSFGRSFNHNSTKLRHWCRSSVETPTKLRNQNISTILTKNISTILTKQYPLFYKIISTLLTNKYPQFWQTNIHNLHQQIVRFEIWLIVRILTKSKFWLIVTILTIIHIYIYIYIYTARRASRAAYRRLVPDA